MRVHFVYSGSSWSIDWCDTSLLYTCFIYNTSSSSNTSSHIIILSSFLLRSYFILTNPRTHAYCTDATVYRQLANPKAGSRKSPPYAAKILSIVPVCHNINNSGFFNTVTLQIFLLIPIPSICNYRLFTVVFYILCAILLLYCLRHVKLFIKRIWMNEMNVRRRDVSCYLPNELAALDKL